MKGSWKAAAGMALAAVIGFGLIASRSQARPATSGHFKVPFDVQWGSVNLTSGEYSFAMDHITANGSIVLYRGTQAVGFIRPSTLDSSASESKSSELLCIRHDGKFTVRALELPQVGTFYFSLPKDLKTIAAQQPQLIETVAVNVSGE